MDWHRLVVDIGLLLLVGFSLVQLARTTWHAQARAAECERLYASFKLAEHPETTGLAHQIAPGPVSIPGAGRHPAFNGAVPLEVRERLYDEINAP